EGHGLPGARRAGDEAVAVPVLGEEVDRARPLAEEDLVHQRQSSTDRAAAEGASPRPDRAVGVLPEEEPRDRPVERPRPGDGHEPADADRDVSAPAERKI